MAIGKIRKRDRERQKTEDERIAEGVGGKKWNKVEIYVKVSLSLRQECSGTSGSTMRMSQERSRETFHGKSCVTDESRQFLQDSEQDSGSNPTKTDGRNGGHKNLKGIKSNRFS